MAGEVDRLGPLGPLRASATVELAIQLLRSFPGRAADVRAVLNGLIGDELAEQGSSLAVPLSFRTRAGDELPLEREALGRALPDAGPRLCVLVHGLMSSETVWRFAGRPRLTYGELLAAEHGVTPVYVRYNTGLHISTNGRELAAALQRLVRAWPVRVREIGLIGHSMGGLVVRSACHYGRHSGTVRDRLRRRGPWPARVRRIVLLGTPNRGATLEVIANLVSAALWSVPVPITRLVGSGIDRRSDGIKDLRWGAVLDEDWLERDPAATEPPRRHRVHVPRRAEILVVGGTLAALPGGTSLELVDRVLGDGLVSAVSTEGRPVDDEPALLPHVTLRRLPRINHIALANHPHVHREITAWWGGTG
ncbi:MAG: esterase/lipase family protein [Acidimicrobiia bacterium]